MTTWVLVPSPFLGPTTWAPVADRMRSDGHEVVVVDPAGATTPDAVLTAVIEAAAGHDSIVLAPHSNAGLYAPLLADLLPVSATVFADAALPGPGASTRLAPPALRDHVAGLVDDQGLLPPWTSWWEEVDELFPDAAIRHAVEAEQTPMPLAYLEAALAVPARWAERSCAYLAFGTTYADEVAAARGRGWPHRVLDGGHLHQLHDPTSVVASLLDLHRQLA